VIPEKVYHYTKKETALETILFTQKLKLSQLGLTNDPYETKNWGFNVLNPPEHNEIGNFLSEMSSIQIEANSI